MKRQPWIWSLLLLATGLLLSCSPGSPPAPGLDPRDVTPLFSIGGGIGGTGQQIGPMQATGVVRVGGTEWDTTSAMIIVDETFATAADLGEGMVLRIAGTFSGAGRSGIAQLIEYDASIEGPVSSISIGLEPDQRTLDVLGQTVILDADATVFVGTSLDGVALSDVLEISGLIDDLDRLHATRVLDRGTFVLGSTPVTRRGTVRNFDGVSSFDIDGLSIVFDASTDLSQLPGGVVEDRQVEVEGVVTSAATILATSIDIEIPIPQRLETLRLEGFVSSFGSLDSFQVSGTTVDATGGILLPDLPDAFGDGEAVFVSGSVVGGALTAELLRSRSRDLRIESEVASASDIDAVGGTVRLLGVTVHVDAITQSRDDLFGVSDFRLKDVAAGDFLEVRGFVDEFGDLVADELRRDDSDDVRFRARVEDFDSVAGTFVLLGQTISTDGLTEFEDEFGGVFPSRDAFFAALRLGDLVKVRDREDGDEATIDVADDVEFEFED